MKTRTLHGIVYVLMLACVAVTAVFLILLPDRVPVHWDFAGRVDRIGSKFENLIWPLFALGMGGAFLLIARHEGRKNGGNNEKIMLAAAAVNLLVFTLLGFIFMLKAMRYDPEAESGINAGDVFRLTSVCIGILLALVGNLLPKVRKNSFIGLRVKWSMASDSLWQKSQRFCGITSVIAGVILILSALFVPGMWNLAALTGVMVIWLLLNLVAARRYWLAEQASEGKE